LNPIVVKEQHVHLNSS